MNALFTRTLILAWGVWLGGLVGVLLAVSTIFNKLAPDRHAAGEIARLVFKRADMLVFTVAAVALISATMLLVSWKSLSRKGVFACIVLAAMLAIASGAVISPKINAMATAGTTDTSEFKKLHGLSMVIALVEMIALAGAGVFLPGAVREKQ